VGVVAFYFAVGFVDEVIFMLNILHRNLIQGMSISPGTHALSIVGFFSFSLFLFVFSEFHARDYDIVIKASEQPAEGDFHCLPVGLHKYRRLIEI
jgi:hypothetical protein